MSERDRRGVGGQLSLVSNCRLCLAEGLQHCASVKVGVRLLPSVSVALWVLLGGDPAGTLGCSTLESFSLGCLFGGCSTSLSQSLMCGTVDTCLKWGKAAA